MTKHQLKTRVFAITTYFLAIIFIAAISYFAQTNRSIYTFIKELSSLLIALPVAYLTYCLQKRQVHLAVLKDLWKEANEAKAEIIQYSHLTNPKLNDFAKAHRAISKAIDSVRAVYKNEGESETAIGLNPFEPLRDMCRSLERLFPSDLTHEFRSAERKKIITAWNAFRWAFLREFQAPAAPCPITEVGACDPRRTKNI